MFKVVQTVEDEEVCLSVVPSKWEREGILMWPKKRNVSKLVRDEKSEPGIDWTKMACIVKRVTDTYEEAELEISRMENHADTDSDAVDQPGKSINIETLDIDLNALLDSAENVEDNTLIELAPPKPVVIQPQNNLFEMVQNVLTNQTTLINNQQILERNQTSIAQAIARLEAKLDYSFGDSDKKAVPDDDDDVFFQPVDSKEDLEKLEKNLEDGEFRLKLFHKLKFVCGTTGREEGLRMAYKLVNYLWTPGFLTKCSWTGAARAKVPDACGETSTVGETSTALGAQEPAKEKVPFKFYKRNIDFFLSLLIKADNSFSAAALEGFLKTVLKNAVQRFKSTQQISAPKKRPSNLIYKNSKKSKVSPEQVSETQAFNPEEV